MSGDSEVASFERELASLLGTPRALGVNSGTSALMCAYAACRIGPGDEVLVPAYTWVSTAAAVLASGAVPVLVDVDETLTIDLDDAARKVGPRTRAVVPVHMHNMVCDMDGVAELAERCDLMVIEDACQALGTTYRRRPVGTIGDVGAFSFQQFKTIYAGEGGAVVTNDRGLWERATMFHDVGSYSRAGRDVVDESLIIGLGLRMPEIAGAILRPQLRVLGQRIDRLRRHRRIAVDHLTDRLGPGRIAHHHDEADGAALTIVFEDSSAASAFAGRCRGVTRPCETGRHVFRNWESVVSFVPVHERADPYMWAERDVGVEACAPTLDILERTCIVPLRMDFPTPVYRAWLEVAIPRWTDEP